MRPSFIIETNDPVGRDGEGAGRNHREWRNVRERFFPTDPQKTVLGEYGI